MDVPADGVEDGLAFLLSQVGAHASSRFAARLKTMGLKPAHAGVLRLVRHSDGLSQQALGERLSVFPSRLVGLIDDLERRGFVMRRRSQDDRRAYQLHATAAGISAHDQIEEIALLHQSEVCAALDDDEKSRLAGMLRRIAQQQGLRAGAHPHLAGT